VTTAIMWCVCVAAILGTELNVRKRREGFALWAVTNLVFIVRNACIGEWPQAMLFGVYLVMCIRGWRSWKGC
jgi:nicotinamide riboside transporter PnuC